MSDELTGRLRELAETAEIPPPVSGADVRAAAGRRRRRRRTTAGVAGGCAAAALTVFVTLNLAAHGTQQRPSPAATATSTFTAAAPDATVDLSRRVLIVADRELPISAGTPKSPTPTGRMTVTVKSSTMRVTGETVGFGDAYEMRLSWVLELSPVDASATGGEDEDEDEDEDEGVGVGGDDVGDARGTSDTADPSATDATDATMDPGATDADERVSGTPTQSPARSAVPVYIAALTYNEKAPGDYDTTNGWIGLRSADARWLYERLPEGAVVEIKGASATPGAIPTPTPSATAPG